MKIDKDTIKYIANLAMIKIDEDEEEKYAKSLEQILTYTEILNNIDSNDLPEDDEFKTEFNKFRPDEVKLNNDTEELLSNAPESQNNMFKIPKVIQ